ncbi:aspartate aminotransferase family protein [Alteribacter natronophilus]|uniref:aspartate aminotransferase family protein n=1 Tax=Alteribacter natronophilus TaxID=2583810 RepID=UPI001FE8697D|nr:aspartate aminotransferase family protein [Alteribacter natronophilus]
MAIHRFSHPLPMYLERTKESYRLQTEGRDHLPGGVTANIKHFAPYPIVMKHGEGAELTDVDQNKYVDFLMGYGSLALGHGHPAVTGAIGRQMQTDGTCLFGTPHELEFKYAGKIKSYFPSMERLRYTNSGTEATLLALRLAYAYTGKTKLAKFEGHYHGGYNEVLYSINPDTARAGNPDEPRSVPESAGLLPGGDENTIILPFNNIDATERILRRNQNDLAAVMIEPVQGGFIPADESFISRLREVTEELGIVLIFDEVKTGFRSALGGAQQSYQVTPDLTTLGKVIGGGFPFGIVGGKKEIMDISSPKAGSDVFDTLQSRNSSSEDTLFHSGTYNGHPMILAAGLAVIEELEKSYAAALQFTDHFRKELSAFFAAKGLPFQTAGMGTIFNLIFSAEEVRNYRDMQKADLGFRKDLDLHLINEGIYTKPLNRYSIATVHTDRELARTMDALHNIFNHRLGGS